MPELNLVIPFALPPPEHARDLIAGLNMPAFARLLARATRGQASESPGFDACLPHERWLSGQTGNNSPALAHTLMQALGIDAPTGVWFVLQPVHLHIARDHLVLTDYRQLHLSDEEAQSLFTDTLPLFEEQNQALVYGNARYWFMRADSWQALRTCTPDVSCGHNIDIWLPTGSAARDWRRLQNEVQMLWHQHAVNETREQQGLIRVNGLWLWGASTELATNPGAQLLARQLASTGEVPPTTAADNEILWIDTLTPHALTDDWAGWLQQLSALEASCFMPMLSALESGQLQRVNLILTDGTRLQQWTARLSSMRKFWLTPSLSRLAP